MGYFRELPDLDYQSFLSTRSSNEEYLRVKNLFRRNKIRDDLQSVFTVFDKYKIVEGARPDTIADEIYGSSELDWVVLLSAGITNIRNQWPLSNRDLYNYVEKKYGIENMNAIHHYETKEIKDSLGKLIMTEGNIVDENFSINYYDLGLKRQVFNDKTYSRRGITNYEYESKKNDEKSSIYILKPGYIQQFLSDMRFNMLYGKSTEYVNDKLIRTQNTRQLDL